MYNNFSLLFLGISIQYMYIFLNVAYVGIHDVLYIRAAFYTIRFFKEIPHTK